ncbi:MAG: hypothetical protein U0324_24550 [Polyangiales bacterium]
MNVEEAVAMCTPRSLPADQWLEAARKAQEVNPENVPEGAILEDLARDGERLALDIRRRWARKGVKLTVGFIDTPADLRARLLSHMNAWGNTANVSFVESNTDPKVRVARFTAAEARPGMDGYWSYLGTDILTIPRDEPTMNLEAFTMDTSEAEFRRVVRHEAGHTLGFPHEHMRAALIQRLDREKTIAHFMRTQGWSRQEVINQVLTPLEERQLIGTPQADETSVMCYEIPGFLTKDGRAIAGGHDINKTDAAFAGRLYPKAAHSA